MHPQHHLCNKIWWTLMDVPFQLSEWEENGLSRARPITAGPTLCGATRLNPIIVLSLWMQVFQLERESSLKAESGPQKPSRPTRGDPSIQASYGAKLDLILSSDPQPLTIEHVEELMTNSVQEASKDTIPQREQGEAAKPWNEPGISRPFITTASWARSGKEESNVQRCQKASQQTEEWIIWSQS